MQLTNIVCLTTYTSNQILLVKINGIGDAHSTSPISIKTAPIDRGMGLFWTGASLWVAGRCHLWRFDNYLSPGQVHEGHDALLIPAASFRIGEVDSHELVVTEAGEPVFVNTAFSCLATVRPGCSFAPIWTPPFITGLAAEDRCHLNGVALQNGEPTWVTACSQGDSAASWRNHRGMGGVVVHVPSSEIVATGLSMPHSPRWYSGRLWILNSGSGELGWIEPSSGAFHPIAQLPGFARGLSIQDGKALVTISKLRSPQSNGLVVAERLRNSNKPDGTCGVRVIDLKTGDVLGGLDLPESIDEIFDVALLPVIQKARLLAQDADDAERLIKLPDQVGLLTTRPKISAPTAITSAGATQRYQRIFHLTPDNLAPYAALTFPSLAPGSNAHRKLLGELVGVCALAGDQMIGLAIAERRNAEEAQVVSLNVQPDWRRRGVGGRLMKNLLACLHQEGVSSLLIQYQSGAESTTALEHLLANQGWSEPSDTFVLLEGRAERLATVPWADNYPITPPYRLELWQQHHGDQAQKLNAPVSLLAATASQTLEPNLSLALLHNEQLVGWVLADRTTSTQVRYSSLFVAPAHRGRARGLALLASAFQRQGELGPPIARAGVAPESAAMIRLAQRHLRPFLENISWARRSEIALPRARQTKTKAPTGP